MMNIYRRIVIGIYAIIVSIVGFIYVPCHLVWGTTNEIRIVNFQYVPIWKLIDPTRIINDSALFYKLNLVRIFYTLFIITLITISILVIIPGNKKYIKQNK